MSEEFDFLDKNGAIPEALLRQSPVLSEHLAAVTGEQVFDRLPYSRRERQLMTLASLSALGGAERQLEAHVALSLAAGASPDEIVSAAEHAAVYAGIPRALNALAVIRRSLAANGCPDWTLSRTVDIGGRRVFHLDTGGMGPVLVLCHALSLDHRMWIDVARQLAPRFRILAPDLVGHGPREAAVPAVEGVAADVIRFLDAKGITHFRLAGISMGGAVAQHVAAQARQRIDGLVLMATMLRGSPIFSERAEIGEREGVASQIPRTLVRWFTADDLAAGRSGVRYARARLEKTSIGRWSSAWRSLAAHELPSCLSTLDCQVTCVGGSEDSSCPPAVIEELHAAIPTSRIRTVAGGAHLFPLTQAVETSGLLSEILE